MNNRLAAQSTSHSSRRKWIGQVSGATLLAGCSWPLHSREFAFGSPGSLDQYHDLTLQQETARAENSRPRCSELGIKIGVLPSGATNHISDVGEISVGHTTLVEGDAIRTGVTAILPHRDNLFRNKVPAAIVVGNGFGKLVGSTQVNELGTLETPIGLTNTLSTFQVADAIVKHSLELPGNEQVRSVNPVVGECNDGYLNDIRGQHVRGEHLASAIAQALEHPSLDEGCVGAGTGTRCLGWKGGVGSASRRLPDSLGGTKVGVLVQTNFGGTLTVAGAPVGRELDRYYLREVAIDEASQERGSCIVVIATDAPLDHRQLTRLANRAFLGLAAVGSPMTHGSGEYAIAFSTDPAVRVSDRSETTVESRPAYRDDRMSPLFQAVRDATEEAVLNSMFRATSMEGRLGHRSDAIDTEQVIDVCRRHGVL